MSDKSDKTVFRQPTPGGDRTVMRPAPGSRSGQTMQRPPTQPTYSNQGGAIPTQSGIDTFQGAAFHTSIGLNPLVNAASVLIAVFGKIQHIMSHPDPSGLYQRLTGEIRQFENRARDKGIRPEVILAARYVLCTALDEAVLNTPWGAESSWGQKTLLSTFHNETAGGEKFFMIVDRMRHSPSENLDMLELLYLCISLGFEGKYRVIHRGKEMLEQIKDELFSIIRRYRGEYERDLSPSWKGLGKIRNTLAEYIPMWVVASIIGGILLLSYTGFRYWLYVSSAPVAEHLTAIATEKNQKNLQQ